MTRVKIVRASEDLKHYAAAIYGFPENYKGFQALFNGDYSAFFSSLNFSINAYASDFKKNSEKFAKGFSVADSKSLFGGIDMRGRASNNSPFCAIKKRKWRAREEVRCLSVAPIRD